MAAADTGPRYAPEDPTLPAPWKGLIDGSTGTLYYWNPDTNVTQYEKPSAPAPPLPVGVPPGGAAPKLAPIPAARAPVQNGVVPDQQIQPAQPQPYQQMPMQYGQQMQPQQPIQQLPYQQMPSQQYQQIPPQQPQQYPQMQVPYAQGPYMQGQMMPHPQDQQMQGPGSGSGSGPQAPYQQWPMPSQVPYQQVQQPQGPNAVHEQGPPQQETHGMHSQGQQSPLTQNLRPVQVPDQQGQRPQGPSSMHPQGQHQVQQSPNQQVQHPGFPRVEEPGRPERRPTGFSPQMVQQPGPNSSNYHLPSAAHQVQISPVRAPSVPSQERVGGPPGADPSYRQWQGGSNPMDHSVRPPMGSRMGYQESPRDRMGNELRSSGTMLSPREPKLAIRPPIQNHQDMRMGPISAPFTAPGQSGGLNMAPAHALPIKYDRGAFPNVASTRPSPGVFGPPELPHGSTADAYCLHHEVSTMLMEGKSIDA